MESELGPLGYSITLKSIPPHFLENIRNELTVKPIENPNFPSNEPAFPVYRLSKNKVYLPRYYALNAYNEPKKISLSDGDPVDLPFHGTLRDIQEYSVNATVNAYQENGLSIISLDTGLGKTVVALNLVSVMKVKTIILVHAEFLLEQWKARIEQYLPNARIGIIRQEKCQTEDVDISIGMIQTIVNREYPKGFFKSYGQTVIDECFSGDQEISTIYGFANFEAIYNLWIHGFTLPMVFSFNETTKQLELKQITYVWKKKNVIKLLEIHCENGSFKCTPNHKILTPYGLSLIHI